MNFQKIFLSALNRIIFLLIILTLFSCNLLNPDNENSLRTDEPIPVPFKTLGSDTVYCGLQNIDYKASVDELSGVELIITNESDYKKYITCSEQVKINFDEDFVLAGISTIQPNCVYVKQQNVQLLSDTLKYKVTIGDMDCAMPDRAQYIVVVSKKYFDHPVKFIVERER